jgi:hypothetical protein
MGYRSVDGTVHKHHLLNKGCRYYYYYFFIMTYMVGEGRVCTNNGLDKKYVIEKRVDAKSIVVAIPCRLRYATSVAGLTPVFLKLD